MVSVLSSYTFEVTQVLRPHPSCRCSISEPLAVPAASEASQSTRQVVDTSKVMMKAANTLFDTSSANQRSLHQITNNLIKLMMDRPGELGGFGDPTTAKSARGMLKSLAKVLHGCLPTTTTIKPHWFLSMQHPKSV